MYDSSHYCALQLFIDLNLAAEVSVISTTMLVWVVHTEEPVCMCEYE